MVPTEYNVKQLEYSSYSSDSFEISSRNYPRRNYHVRLLPKKVKHQQ